MKNTGVLNITGEDAVQQNVLYNNLIGLIAVLYVWVMYVRVIILGDPGAGRKENLSHPDKLPLGLRGSVK